MNYNELIEGMHRFGSTHDDICRMFLGIGKESIRESVIIAPWWEPEVFGPIGDSAEFLVQSANVSVWNLKSAELEITYVKTGIGAPVLGDVVLALGLTDCKRLLFVGSVGSLDPDIDIGEIVIPEYAICGDGVSRYLSGDNLAESDTFGQKSYPDRGLFEKLTQCVSAECKESEVRYHIGRNFSIDTIFAQFVYIDEIVEMGCNVIEMETAAAFRASELAGLPMAALFSVSDNTVTNKSLVSGRTEEEQQYRKHVRRNVFPRIWERFFLISDNG